MRKTKLYNIWTGIHSSFWFIPAAMIVFSFMFSIFSLYIDHYFYEKQLFRSIEQNESSLLEYFFYVGPEGARAVLTTISGSMITVAGVTFSITIVALTLAASQFGSRLLRNFMQDKSTQFVLGVFLSTYIYCVLILRSVQSHYDKYFAPVFSVNCAVIMAVLGAGVLIYFIHHIAVSIKAEYVIGSVYEQLKLDIERIVSEMSLNSEEGTAEKEDDASKLEDVFGSYPVENDFYSKSDGYVQAIDFEKLLDVSAQNDMIIELGISSGNYSTTGAVIGKMRSRGSLQEGVIDELAEAFIFGSQRTPEQDIEFGIHQIVEVAVRSLSPSINDPFTAISCIDNLSSILCILASRKAPRRRCYDVDGNLRLIRKPLRYGDVLDSAFNQIRQNSRSSVAVTISLMGAFARISQILENPDHQKELKRHVEMLFKQGEQTIKDEYDWCDFKKRHDEYLSSSTL